MPAGGDLERFFRFVWQVNLGGDGNAHAQIKALAGAFLFVPASASPPLPEDAFWPHQLVGADVVTAEGRPIGRMREVIHAPANDVWVVDGPSGAELLVPALRDVVRSVDVEGRRIVVAEVPGLTVPEDGNDG